MNKIQVLKAIMHIYIYFFFTFIQKIQSVCTRLSKHLIAIDHLNKFESASISIYKQTKKKKKERKKRNM